MTHPDFSLTEIERQIFPLETHGTVYAIKAEWYEKGLWEFRDLGPDDKPVTEPGIPAGFVVVRTDPEHEAAFRAASIDAVLQIAVTEAVIHIQAGHPNLAVSRMNAALFRVQNTPTPADT